MIGYYMYQTYWRVAVGQLHKQIEFNKELLRLYEADKKTDWNTTLVHTPKAEVKEVLTCRNGCCRFSP
jgi:hypothetical protein